MLTDLSVFLCFRSTMPRVKNWFELGQDITPLARMSAALDQDDVASFIDRDVVCSELTGILNRDVGSYIAEWHLRSFKTALIC